MSQSGPVSEEQQAQIAKSIESYFTKTAPQHFNSQTLPAFDAAAGHQLVAGQAVSLQRFPEGAYRLEIRITDNTNGMTLTRSVNFGVR